jgi:hypothetical protein
MIGLLLEILSGLSRCAQSPLDGIKSDSLRGRSWPVLPRANFDGTVALACVRGRSLNFDVHNDAFRIAVHGIHETRLPATYLGAWQTSP